MRLLLPPTSTSPSPTLPQLALSFLACQLTVQVNERLTEMDIKLMEGALGSKDYSVVKDGDVVILPAFGATIQEMQFLDAKYVFHDSGAQSADDITLEGRIDRNLYL